MASRPAISVYLLPFLLAGLSFACSPAQTNVTPLSGAAPRARSTEPASIEVESTVVTPSQSFGVTEVFDAGMRAFEARDYASARSHFDALLRAVPQAQEAPESLYFSALASEELGEHEQAALRFERLVRRYSGAPRESEAQARALRLLVYLEQWERAGDLAEVNFHRLEHSSPRNQLVILSARALALLERGDPEGAEYFIGRARQLIDEHRLDGAGVIPRDLAQVYFALGELRRQRGEAITFSPLPPDFADVFEQRAQLLLDAQAAYSDAMRAHDAHWTAMAGFRVGELYARLHRDVKAMPRPEEVKGGSQAQLFEEAMRLRYSILLKKGLRMFEHTLGMAERTGETSVWVEKARIAHAQMRVSLAEEEAALRRSPYSREQIESVLRQMQEAQP